MSEMRGNLNSIAELRTVVVDGFAEMNARFDGLQGQVDFIATAVASHDESISEVHCRRAARNVHEAIEGHISALRETGQAVPEPTLQAEIVHVG